MKKNLKSPQVILALFAVIGVIAGVSVFAATDPISVEAENSASSVSDTTASDNKFFQFKDKVVIPPPSAGSNSIENVISDIWGKPGNTQSGIGGVYGPWAKNDAHPEVPGGYDFYDGARASAWNDVGAVPWVQPWCTAYRDENGIGETNWRLQIRNYKYSEYVNDSWDTMYEQGNSHWGGAFFNKAVQGSVGGNFQFRNDGDGKQSVPWNDAAAGLHPWGERRVHTKFGSARFATAEMRLVPNTNPNVDLSKVKVLGVCTWDSYSGSNCGKSNTCIVHDGLYPRHKYITSQWQHFNAISVPIDNPGDKPSFTYEYAAQAIRDINPPVNR